RPERSQGTAAAQRHRSKRAAPQGRVRVRRGQVGGARCPSAAPQRGGARCLIVAPGAQTLWLWRAVRPWELAAVRAPDPIASVLRQNPDLAQVLAQNIFD